MRKCSKCQREFDDLVAFCPECGTKLENFVPVPSEPVTVGAMQQYKDASAKLDSSENVLAQFLASILVIVGLIITWEVSALIGLVIAAVGLLIGWYSTNQLNKIVSLTVGIVTVVLSIWTIID